MTEQTETSQRPVLVVDFGAQYAQLIARRVREAGVYSEIVPHTATAEEIAAKSPVGIILSGGPSSVYEPGAPALDTGVFDLGVPTLGICYGFQVMARALGGEVANTGLREYGATDATIVTEGTLLEGQPAEQNVWMSHGDQVSRAPEGFDVLARTGATPGTLESWLALRGLRTLGVRLAEASRTAEFLVDRLASHPAVTRVRYPGSGAMVAFELADGDAAERACAKLELIHNATSLGGVETTVERRAHLPGDSHVPAGLLRLSVGLEDPEDLWRDLERALGA